MSINVLTYGSFDTLHYGHINFLTGAKSYGDRLFVGLSTDLFMERAKKKTPFLPYEKRYEILSAVGCVDYIFPEECIMQKENDIKKFDIDALVMSKEWQNKFDYLKKFCNVFYLERTPGISSTLIKSNIINQRF